MIYILALISLLFVAIGYIVNEKNAKYLLAGYNSMSEEDRKQLDIKSFLPFFRKFHIFLGISLFIIFILINQLISSNTAGIFFAIYPILGYCYFILASDKYNGNKKASWSRMGVGILLLTLVFVISIIAYGFKENTISFDSDKIEFHGSYGEVVRREQIKSLELVERIPKITIRTNGFSLGEIRKGYFTSGMGEIVKLIINAEKSPLILFTKTNDKKIYYSSKSRSNEELFTEITKALPITESK